jgi:hypothetical protein
MITVMNEAERLARATLLFHRGGMWTEQDRATWRTLTGSEHATTVTLCLLARAITEPSWRCPRCAALTFHPRDIEQRYCGRCHRFAETEGAP